MVQVWYPMTVCTNSRAQKEVIAKVRTATSTRTVSGKKRSKKDIVFFYQHTCIQMQIYFV